MKDFLDKHGVGVIVLTLVIAGLLLGGIVDGCQNKADPTGVAVDSTTYYKNLYQQGKLNYEFHSKLKYHEEQIQRISDGLRLDTKRINSLRGADLQREVDRQFNEPASDPDADGHKRQPQAAPAGSRQNNPVNRGGSASGPPVQSRSNGEPGHNCPEGLDAVNTVGYDFSTEIGYPADERTRPGRPAKIGEVSSGFRSGKEEAAPFTARKLGVAGSEPSGFVLENKESVGRNNFRRMILRQQYRYPRVALAISSVETGRWKPDTDIIRQRNLFAMKQNARKNYVALRDGYVVFASYQACLDDYGQYEQAVVRKYGLDSEQKYIDHICKRFCRDPAYRPKLLAALDGSSN